MRAFAKRSRVGEDTIYHLLEGHGWMTLGFSDVDKMLIALGAEFLWYEDPLRQFYVDNPCQGEGCTNSLDSDHHAAKYCSDNCRRLAQNKTQRECYYRRHHGTR